MTEGDCKISSISVTYSYQHPFTRFLPHSPKETEESQNNVGKQSESESEGESVSESNFEENKEMRKRERWILKFLKNTEGVDRTRDLGRVITDGL